MQLWRKLCSNGRGQFSRRRGGKNRILAPLSKVRKVSAAYHFIFFVPPREIEKKYIFRTRKSDIHKMLAIPPPPRQFRKPIFCPPLVALVPSMYALHPTLYSSPFLPLKAKLHHPFFLWGGKAELRVACKRRRRFFQRGGRGSESVWAEKLQAALWRAKFAQYLPSRKQFDFFAQIISANMNCVSE